MFTVPASVGLAIVILAAIIWTFEKAGKAQKRAREKQARQALTRDLNRSSPTTTNLPYGLGDDDSTPPTPSGPSTQA